MVDSELKIFIFGGIIMELVLSYRDFAFPLMV